MGKESGQKPGGGDAGAGGTQPPTQLVAGADAVRSDEVASQHQAGDADATAVPPEQVAPAASAPAAAAAPTAIGMIGRSVGPYRIVAELGAGGMGAVYLADQFHPVRRQVALKLIHAGMDSADLKARFQSERDLLARMNHPNIAQVLDVGSAEDGRLYFAMEYVPGVPLQSFCDARGLDVGHRLELFLQACEGVQHAHQKGVIHRDLKPANLMVADYQGRLLVKVIDFGIAKGVDQFGRLEPGTTRAGTPIGTPAYMSPEQARGEAGAVDTRTDVYALGGVLYKLLTDETPVAEDVISRSGEVGLARALSEAVILPPSQRVLASAGRVDSEWRRRMAADPPTHARRLRGDLDWIALKALAQERERRYASVSELAADVKRHLAGEPVLASPPGRGYRLSKFVRRHRAMVGTAAAVLLALVAGVVGTTWMAMEARAQRDRAEAALATAELERSRAEEQRARAEASNSFLESMIAAPDPWKLQGARVDARSVRVLDVLADAQRVYAERRAADPILHASIGTLLGRTLRRLGELQPAAVILGQAREDAAGAGRKDLAAHADAELALVHAASGDLPAAHAGLTALLADGDALAVLDKDTEAELRRVAAEVALDRGELERAEQLGRENLQATVASHGEDATASSGARASLSWILGARGEWDEAEALAQAAYAAERRRLGPAHPTTLELLGRLAALPLRKGDYALAERRYREAASFAAQVLGDRHPQTLAMEAHVAAAIDNGGRSAEALALFDDVIPRAEQVFGSEHADVLLMRANRAVALRNLRRFDDSASEMESVLEARRRVLGENHPETMRTLMVLAVLARDRGDLERADVLLSQVAALHAELYGELHPESIIMAMNHLAVVRERKDNERAAAGYAELLPRAERALPAGHWHLAALRGSYGLALLRTGRTEQAEPLIIGAWRSMAAQFPAEDPRVVTTRKWAEAYLEEAGKPASLLDPQP